MDYKIDYEKLPAHIGIIMDGNGRWAKKRGLPRSAGHEAGGKAFKKIVKYCNKIGIKHMTVYAFSTENWKRPKSEVDYLTELFRRYLKDVKNYSKENVRVNFIGDCSVFDADIREKMHMVSEGGKNADGLVLNIAVNYGGRAEITNAVKQISEKVKNGSLLLSEINEDCINSHLYTKNQPEVDLIIRPGGESRISNFLIWQGAYAEYVFIDDVLWPDFTEKDIDDAIIKYQQRNRRFGNIK